MKIWKWKMWRVWAAGVGAGMLFLLAFSSPHSCLTCHSHKEKSGKYFWAYEGWKESAHGRAKITCDRCHGGKPTEASQEKAHQGVLPSSDKQSLIHFQNVAKTCGGCHGAQWIAFQNSTHYKMLMAQERGPTCSTCHGSMHTTVAMSKEVQEFCSLCHNEQTGNRPEIPEKASLLLLSMEQNALLLKVAEKRLTSQPAGRKNSPLLTRLPEAKASYETSQMTWHQFDLTQALEATRRTFSLLKELLPQ